MTTLDYYGIADDVLAAISAAGYEITSKRKAISASDVATGVVTPAQSQTFSYVGVQLPVTEKSLSGLDLKFGENVLTDCRILYLASRGAFAPKPDDIFDLGDGESWLALSCTKISPAKIDVLYIVGVVMQ